MAQLERDIIAERVKAGLRRAKENRKTLGRPQGTSLDIETANRLRREGMGLRQIAEKLGSSKTPWAECLLNGPIKPSKFWESEPL